MSDQCPRDPNRRCDCREKSVPCVVDENVTALPFCVQLDSALREQSAQSSIAAEAQDMVYGDRQDDYGHPREDFTRAAILWTGLLQHKLADGAFVDADDIARCMIGVKLARDVHAPKRDNRVDIVGYAITLDRLETGR